MNPQLVIAGALAQSARNGGLTWCFLQLVLGFRRLGYDVLFLDRLEPEMCRDENGQPATLEQSVNLRYFLDVMERFGLGDAFSLDYQRGTHVIGQPRTRVLEHIAAADFLLNVMGYLDDTGILEKARRRVFLDIDPGFPQMWRELGLHDAFRGHDAFVTLGCNIGKPGCAIPTCGLRWVTMPQPVVLEHWPMVDPSPPPLSPRGREENSPSKKGSGPLEEGVRPHFDGGRGEAAAFTSIGAWRGKNAPVEYQGRTYGLRVHEFRKFASLPAWCPGVRFELALDIHAADHRDRQLLRDQGWRLVDPSQVAGGPWAYRAYIAGSRAEFMVPKEMYVATNSGLLSDRSMYYLASGRPVLARDTGLEGLYPTGEGLLLFTTLDEAVAGVEEIDRDYARHVKAAREIAVEFADSDKVLTRLISDLGAA